MIDNSYISKGYYEQLCGYIEKHKYNELIPKKAQLTKTDSRNRKPG